MILEVSITIQGLSSFLHKFGSNIYLNFPHKVIFIITELSIKIDKS